MLPPDNRDLESEGPWGIQEHILGITWSIINFMTNAQIDVLKFLLSKHRTPHEPTQNKGVCQG